MRNFYTRNVRQSQRLGEQKSYLLEFGNAEIPIAVLRLVRTCLTHEGALTVTTLRAAASGWSFLDGAIKFLVPHSNFLF
jgi:hypothetical protein